MNPSKWRLLLPTVDDLAFLGRCGGRIIAGQLRIQLRKDRDHGGFQFGIGLGRVDDRAELGQQWPDRSLAHAGEGRLGLGLNGRVAAGKMRGIYAAVCHDTYSAHQGVEHDHMNVLCLGGRVIGHELAREIIRSFVNARFIGNDQGEERHNRRFRKVRKIEDIHLNK